MKFRFEVDIMNNTIENINNNYDELFIKIDQSEEKVKIKQDNLQYLVKFQLK